MVETIADQIGVIQERLNGYGNIIECGDREGIDAAVWEGGFFICKVEAESSVYEAYN
jgi:hypothetical protein